MLPKEKSVKAQSTVLRFTRLARLLKAVLIDTRLRYSLTSLCNRRQAIDTSVANCVKTPE
jgi:hypothetical protein